MVIIDRYHFKLYQCYYNEVKFNDYDENNGDKLINYKNGSAFLEFTGQGCRI